MEELSKLKIELEDLRGRLNNLVYTKIELIDPKVVQLSQNLDSVISRFIKLKRFHESEDLITK